MSARTYQRIAPLYDLLDLLFELGRYAAIRPLLFAGLSGTILDAGVGTGRNIAHYPAGARVVGIDNSVAMLLRAKRRRARLGASAGLAAMDVLRTGFADRQFDAIVATFLFCVLDDALQLPALVELRRICKPTGTIRILEYAYSSDPRRQAIMRLWAPWVRWAYGAAFNRNTAQYLRAAGLTLVSRRFVFRDTIELIEARPTA